MRRRRGNSLLLYSKIVGYLPPLSKSRRLLRDQALCLLPNLSRLDSHRVCTQPFNAFYANGSPVFQQKLSTPTFFLDSLPGHIDINQRWCVRNMQQGNPITPLLNATPAMNKKDQCLACYAGLAMHYARGSLWPSFEPAQPTLVFSKCPIDSTSSHYYHSATRTGKFLP